MSFKVGDELWVERHLGPFKYHHAGIYVGNDEVVHVFETPLSAISNLIHDHEIVKIHKTSLEDFTKGDVFHKGPTVPLRSSGTIKEFTMSTVGQDFKYHPINSNCQHFTCYMVSGRWFSMEADLIRQRLRTSEESE